MKDTIESIKSELNEKVVQDDSGEQEDDANQSTKNSYEIPH